MAQPNDRSEKIRRKNWIVLAVLAIFVLAVFLLSFSHIGREARPEPTANATHPAVDG